jgi:predicted house-cleaning noncanonical NTP pyrophosphatase (MazG superfamily)
LAEICEWKKYFYYRSGKTEGDQELEKKMDKDYDDFLKGSTDEEIDRILEVNPKLIYAIKSDILQSLIQ